MPGSASERTVVSRFAQAHRNVDEVVLEGIHAVKHALRFGAEVLHAVTPDRSALLGVANEVAPDISPALERLAEVVSPDCFLQLSRRPPGSPVLAIARAPREGARSVPPGTAVVLVEPRHSGNVGAVIRVAAAAGATSVLVTGPMDPWSSAVVRAAAGLHYALDVRSTHWPPELDRPLLAFDPDEGDPDFQATPSHAAFVFGGERDGLPDTVLASAHRTLRIPMRAGVSSLNLATSVAVALYARSMP